jgi:hypothetical protein
MRARERVGSLGRMAAGVREERGADSMAADLESNSTWVM